MISTTASKISLDSVGTLRTMGQSAGGRPEEMLLTRGLAASRTEAEIGTWHPLSIIKRANASFTHLSGREASQTGSLFNIKEILYSLVLRLSVTRRFCTFFLFFRQTNNIFRYGCSTVVFKCQMAPINAVISPINEVTSSLIVTDFPPLHFSLKHLYHQQTQAL